MELSRWPDITTRTNSVRGGRRQFRKPPLAYNKYIGHMNETINYYVQSRSNISLHWVYTVVAYMYLVNIVALEMANVSSPL